MEEEYDCIIEISLNSTLKFEFDKDNQFMRLDRVINTNIGYPGNYGYIPNTLCPDGDPIDIIMPVEYEIPPGTIVMCRPVGVLMMEDEEGLDDKLIVYPINKVDSSYSSILDITDINQSILDKIEFFFNNYKKLSKGKFVKTYGFKDKNIALDLIQKSIDKFYNSETESDNEENNEVNIEEEIGDMESSYTDTETDTESDIDIK